MTARRRVLISTTSLLGVAAWIAPAAAQERPSAASASAAIAATGQTASSFGQVSPSDIVVVGIRESLEQAAKIKQDSLQVVDSVVAEDIGKFPDPTTAAALQRVPGVQVELGADNEIGGVRIRGLNDILTTIDGREVFSTTGRNFDLQDLPATALRRVNVVKTSTANLIEGGIAGIIDLKLNKPFDFRKPTLVATARGNYGSTRKAEPAILDPRHRSLADRHRRDRCARQFVVAAQQLRLPLSVRGDPSLDLGSGIQSSRLCLAERRRRRQPERIVHP